LRRRRFAYFEIKTRREVLYVADLRKIELSFLIQIPEVSAILPEQDFAKEAGYALSLKILKPLQDLLLFMLPY
jgi:hypothetical protein